MQCIGKMPEHFWLSCPLSLALLHFGRTCPLADDLGRAQKEPNRSNVEAIRRPRMPAGMLPVNWYYEVETGGMSGRSLTLAQKI